MEKDIISALHRIRDEVYYSREENFHWRLDTAVNLNCRAIQTQDVLSNDSDRENCPDSSDDASGILNFAYAEEGMIAARPDNADDVF